ncbi:MAG: hypothetical protein IPN69_08665 [Acidobacteria bacterium]|nr:hypothetical protein [Acidobacteriota bacterium]
MSQSEYVIEKGVPLEKRQPYKKGRFPFDSMEVGDSFVVDKNQYKNARASAALYGKRNGKTFATRTLADKTNVRVWRTS